MKTKLVQPRHYNAHGPIRCAFCMEPSITNLDGDNLCQRHANEWVRGEGIAAREAELGYHG